MKSLWRVAVICGLPAVCGCYNEHPSGEQIFVCVSGNNDCGEGAECIKAGALFVCSSNQSCPGGCTAPEACVNGACQCFSSCDDKNCGDDGCGGSCGTCDVGWWCDGGACVDDCGSAECGTPLNGLSCGTCEAGWWCAAGTCNDDCGTAECGTSPHGLSCGVCEAGWWCDTGTCKDDCADRECGESPNLAVDCGQCGVGYGCKLGDCVKTGDMVQIPAGSFWMGCDTEVDADCGSDETPYHEVTLPVYYIDATEITVAAYGECVAAGACTVPSIDSSNCNSNMTGKETHPVNCVDWFQARKYCAWAGKRLPTEAEWEKAARGTDGRKYPWGNEIATCDYAVMSEVGSSCVTNSTRFVCSKSPAGDSPYGLCDVSGNVWEWVSDWYGSAYYSSSPGTDPVGPASGSSRVMRGGSYYYAEGVLRVSNRDYYDPSASGTNLGFRCARDAL